MYLLESRLSGSLREELTKGLFLLFGIELLSAIVEGDPTFPSEGLLKKALYFTLVLAFYHLGKRFLIQGGKLKASPSPKE